MPVDLPPDPPALTIEAPPGRNMDMERLARLLRGENAQDLSLEEALAIGDTVLTRAALPHYPSTIADVIYQPNQFSPFNPTDPNYEKIMAFNETDPEWAKYMGFAQKILDPKRKRGSFTHYHSTKVNPAWSRALEGKVRKGRHIFGREKASVRKRRKP